MHGAFARLWTTLGEDPDARAVLLTGTGDFFSAGGNLVEWLHTHVNNPVTRREGMRDARRIVRDMIDFPLPIVAAVNGPAVGFGCSIAVLCDIVLMSDRCLLRRYARGQWAGGRRRRIGAVATTDEPAQG